MRAKLQRGPKCDHIDSPGPMENIESLGASIVVGGPPVGVPVRPRRYAHPNVENFMFKFPVSSWAKFPPADSTLWKDYDVCEHIMNCGESYSFFDREHRSRNFAERVRALWL